MTGYNSKRQMSQNKLNDDDDTQVYAGRKRGSIALARSLCYQINGAADDSDDMDGGEYGSVDIAEILSAEVVRLQAALAQPEQQAEPPPEWPLIKNILAVFGLDAISFVAKWQAAQQQAEPVQERITRIAWDERGVRTVNGIPDDAPQRPWQGLTDDDWAKVADMPDTFDQGVAWAAARLKERNT